MMAKRHLYCTRCAGIVAAVEQKVRVAASEKAAKGWDEIQQLRNDLMAAMLPTQLGGNGQGHSEYPPVENG